MTLPPQVPLLPHDWKARVSSPKELVFPGAFYYYSPVIHCSAEKGFKIVFSSRKCLSMNRVHSCHQKDRFRPNPPLRKGFLS